MEDLVYALPPLFHVSPGGHEVSIELRTPADAAPYLCYWHCPHASIDPPQCPRDLSEIIEAEQSIRSVVPLQAGPHPPKQRPSEGAGEVRVYLLLQVHVPNHRRNPFLGLSDLGLLLLLVDGHREQDRGNDRNAALAEGGQVEKS